MCSLSLSGRYEANSQHFLKFAIVEIKSKIGNRIKDQPF